MSPHKLLSGKGIKHYWKYFITFKLILNVNSGKFDSDLNKKILIKFIFEHFIKDSIRFDSSS